MFRGSLEGSGRTTGPAGPASALSEWRETLVAAGATAIAYFLAAQLGLALLSQPSGVAVFWPASGLAAGIMIVSGRRAYPGIVIGVVLGTFAANLLSDRTLLTSLLNGFCNATEAALMAWLLERWCGRPFGFSDFHRVAGFVAAGGLATATSALGGATTMTLLHSAPSFSETWRTWFLSDAVGVVVVAPLVIGLSHALRKRPSRGELFEAAGLLALLAFTSVHTVAHAADSWLSFCLGGIVLPLLLWLIVRCPQMCAIAGAFVVSITVMYAVTFGIGRFGDASVPIAERVQGAQVAVTMITMYTVILAALFAEGVGGKRISNKAGSVFN